MKTKKKKYHTISITLPKDVVKTLEKASKFAGVSLNKVILVICGLEIFKGR